MRMTRKQLKRRARKAARTRAANQAMLKRWREVEQPSTRRMNVLLNYLLRKHGKVEVRWNPVGGDSHNRRLMHGAQSGTLMGFENGGRTLLVLPYGYRNPQTFHPGFWEPILP